ncbi:TetM/TetW/TetO/TetS family tetracycline resistance ribosomal protection protein [Clostridium sp. D53t1_180928_C8]|uniref:GTP-binding protein n=1 Tax=Clostridium sp. D53t1_180928_C8 TaxID=2787101 RepID=UPI0018A98089|nr:TetM/TetW/TetO/TetS family tetracycline resistance ribosomal protection protein [Clostridium sp. D53t1_180928_C8]
MKKTIGILAHVDAGKTTFSEQILYHTNAIRNRGRVDHKNSFLDSHDIEKERGITVFSDQASFELGKSTYYLIDTPGHIDFSCEMERAIGIMDYAIIVVSAVEGVQAHTETVWKLLEKYNVPTFLFINKLDRTGANLENVISEIKINLTKDACYIDNITDIKDDVVEFIAERNDDLLEKYLNGEYNNKLWIDELSKLIKERRIFPCFAGAALQDIGISEFLNSLEELTFTNYNESEEFSGVVYKIRYDDKGTRITFIKSLGGILKVRDEINVKVKNDVLKEKVSSIRIYNGNKFTTVDKVIAGDVFAVTGLTSLNIGDGVGRLKEKIKFNMIPTLMSSVIFDKSCNVKEVLGNFRILEAEDPALNVIWNETLQEIQVHIMGKIQLEVLKEVVLKRFNLNIDFGPCEIIYKETINNKVNGYGHFEPLKHYAEVHLKLESLPRGSGIIFENKCHADHLTTGHQNLIKTHLFERKHNGILTGSEITDIKVTLLTGRAHNKHTEGGDFREATFRALRQGLEKAENVLLEPFYKFNIEVELDYMGRVLSDIQKLYGSFNPPETDLNKVRIVGRGPVSTFMDYSTELIAFTKGRGRINLMFDGYDVCHNTQDILTKRNYNKNADIEYSSNSVFCSKGQGFIVPWNEVEEYMHCEIIEE